MRIVALAQPLTDVEAAAHALASACGLTPAEARMRLNTGPPYLVARVPEEKSAAVLATLRSAKLPAYEVAEPLPDPHQRFPVRELLFEPHALRLIGRGGELEDLPYVEIELLLLGTRVARSYSSKTTTTTKVAIGAAIITGGLKVTKKETTTERSESEVAAQELLVLTRTGKAALIGEAEVAFGCLGKDLQPARLANFQLVVRRLRERAPGARFDDRLLRLGRRPATVIVPAPGGGATDSLDVWSALVTAAARAGLL